MSTYADSLEKLYNAVQVMQWGNYEKFQETVKGIPSKDVNLPLDHYGRTLQHYASVAKDRRFYDLAESYGGSVSNKDTRGLSPSQMRKTASALRDTWSGEDFGDRRVSRRCLQEAINYSSAGDFYSAGTLLDLVPKEHLNDYINLDNRTALHEACAKNASTEFVAALLAKGCSVDIVDKRGDTPLHTLARSDFSAYTQGTIRVLQRASSVGDINARNDKGDTPIMVAAKTGHAEIAHAMLDDDRTDVSIRNNVGENVFHIVAQKWNGEKITSFFDKSAETYEASPIRDAVRIHQDAILTCDDDGISPVGYVARRNLTCVGSLLSKSMEAADSLPGSSEKVRDFLIGGDKDGQVTLLHLACSGRNRYFDSFVHNVVENAKNRCGKEAFTVTDKQGHAAIHVASARSTAKVFGQVLANTPESTLNSPSITGKAPIHYIMDESVGGGKERLQKLKLLVHSEKDLPSINEPSPISGFTPLTQAYKRGYKGVAEVLMASKDINVDAISHDGLSVIHHAAKNCDVKFIKAALLRRAGNSSEHGRKFPMPRDRGEVTPAMYAVREVKDITKLIKVLDQLLPSEPDAGIVAIEAVKKGNRRLVQHIIENVVKPGEQLTNINGENTGLAAEALRAGNYNMAMMLAKAGAPLEGQTKESSLALGLRGGCFEGRDGVAKVKRLIKRGASVNVKPELHVASPLIASIDTGQGKGPNIPVARELLRRGAVPNAKDAHGNTPLHFAALSGNEEVTRMLQKYGASALNANDSGYTPLHVAADVGNSRMFDLLAKKCPDAIKQVNAADFSSVLHVAANSNISQGEFIKILKSAKKHLSPSDFKELIGVQHYYTGDTILHIAARKGHGKACKMLLHAGADVCLLNARGETPLDNAHENLKSIRMSAFSLRTVRDVMSRSMSQIDRDSLKSYEPPVYVDIDRSGFADASDSGRISISSAGVRSSIISSSAGDQSRSGSGDLYEVPRGLDKQQEEGIYAGLDDVRSLSGRDRSLSDYSGNDDHVYTGAEEPVYENVGRKLGTVPDDEGYYSVDDIIDGLGVGDKEIENPGIDGPVYSNINAAGVDDGGNLVGKSKSAVNIAEKRAGSDGERVFGLHNKEQPGIDYAGLQSSGEDVGRTQEADSSKGLSAIHDIGEREMASSSPQVNSHGSAVAAGDNVVELDLSQQSSAVAPDDAHMRGDSEVDKDSPKQKQGLVATFRDAIIKKKGELRHVDTKEKQSIGQQQSLVQGLASVLRKAANKASAVHSDDQDNYLSASDDEWEAEEQEHSSKDAGAVVRSPSSSNAVLRAGSTESQGTGMKEDGVKGINTEGWSREDLSSLQTLADSILQSAVDMEKEEFSGVDQPRSNAESRNGAGASCCDGELSNEAQANSSHAEAIINSRRSGQSGGVVR